MIPMVPKFLASDQHGDHHGMAIRIAIAKCRGWFDHVALEKKAVKQGADELLRDALNKIT